LLLDHFAFSTKPGAPPPRSQSENPVVIWIGWGITGHPHQKMARYFFRIKNVTVSNVEIRQLGENLPQMHLMKPATWSTPESIAPGASIPVAVVYKVANCLDAPVIHVPMRLEERSGSGSWQSLGVKITASDGPKNWSRSVFDAACTLRTVVHV
jgi:hypothetical protein